MKLTGENRSTRGKTSPSATLSTTNPTWTDPGSNPGSTETYRNNVWRRVLHLISSVWRVAVGCFE
jgi:hypothetical protein